MPNIEQSRPQMRAREKKCLPLSTENIQCRSLEHIHTYNIHVHVLNYCSILYVVNAKDYSVLSKRALPLSFHRKPSLLSSIRKQNLYKHHHTSTSARLRASKSSRERGQNLTSMYSLCNTCTKKLCELSAIPT